MNKKNDLFETLFQLNLGLITFFLPSNLFLKIYQTHSFVHGLQIDYLIPKIFVTDILIWSLILIWVLEQTIKRKYDLFNHIQKKHTVTQNKVSFLLFFVFFILMLLQFFSPNRISSFWYGFKLFQMSLFSLVLWGGKRHLNSKSVLLSLTITLVFQASLAMIQFYTQSQLFNYYVLGETNIKQGISIAKTTVNYQEKIIPYGSTAHPNILGGVLSIYLLVLLQFFPKNTVTKKLIFFFIVLLSLLALFLTQSWSAWMSFFVGCILLLVQTFRNKKRRHRANRLLSTTAVLLFLFSPLLISLLATKYPNNSSFSRRDILNQAASNMIMTHPIRGVGMNAFTTKVEEYGKSSEIVRFVQPVHHGGLLLLAENGLIGLGCIIIIYFLIQPHIGLFGLLVLTPIVSVDHYLITTQTGQLLLIFTIFYFHQTKRKKNTH